MEQVKADQDEHRLSPPIPVEGYGGSNVDSSRPFSSVKEAVAIFGQRIHLPGHTQTLNPNPKSPNASPNLSQGASFSSSPWKQTSLPCSPSVPKEEFKDVLQRLEAELKETKTELRMLKERESETEVALATLNAELHKNMSKIAKAEADAAGKSAAAMAKTASFETTNERSNTREISFMKKEDDRRRMEREYPTLAQILDGKKGNRELRFGKKERKKKKPIVPLVADFFFKKKEFSGEISAPLSSTLHFS